MDPAALAALQARFGEQLSTAHAVREAHARDESRMDYCLPDAVLHVQSEQDVVDALRIALEVKTWVRAEEQAVRAERLSLQQLAEELRARELVIQQREAASDRREEDLMYG